MKNKVTHVKSSKIKAGGRKGRTGQALVARPFLPIPSGSAPPPPAAIILSARPRARASTAHGPMGSGAQPERALAGIARYDYCCVHVLPRALFVFLRYRRAGVRGNREALLSHAFD